MVPARFHNQDDHDTVQDLLQGERAVSGVSQSGRLICTARLLLDVLPYRSSSLATYTPGVHIGRLLQLQRSGSIWSSCYSAFATDAMIVPAANADGPCCLAPRATLLQLQRLQLKSCPPWAAKTLPDYALTQERSEHIPAADGGERRHLVPCVVLGCCMCSSRSQARSGSWSCRGRVRCGFCVCFDAT